jgi:protein TonB
MTLICFALSTLKIKFYIMKKNLIWHSGSLIVAAAFSSLLFTACHFDSDKDYKGEEGKVKTDSSERDERAHDQHNPTKPPVDAVRPGDSSIQMSTPASNDSSIKKDSSRGDKPTSAIKSKKGRVTLSDWAVNKSASKEMDKEGIYINADILPEYPGGRKAIQKYIEDNIQYPQAAIDEDVEGTVRITFAIDENGRVYKANTSGKNIGYGLEQEALRVVNNMPKWKPGLVNGKPVKTRLSLPVVFLIS